MTATDTRQPVRERFQQLADQWKRESEHMSNTAQMAMLRSYQGIIGIGEPAIPLILEDLRKESDFWFWALEAITMQNPVPKESAGKVDEMARSWIDWGIANGYLSHDASRLSPPGDGQSYRGGAPQLGEPLPSDSVVERSYGLIGWTGDSDQLRQIAEDDDELHSTEHR